MARGEPLERRDFFLPVTRGVLHLCQADFRAGTGRGEKPPFEVRRSRNGNGLCEEVHRVVDKDPGRRAVGAAEDPAARRVGGL